jgi:uncharacterized membrane protein YbhN (UPF0104 family)
VDKRKITVALRLAVSAALLLYLIRSVDLDQLYAAAHQVDLYWLILSFVILLGLRVVIALRWQVILTHHNMHISLKELIRIIFIGFYFGQVLPGGRP